MRWWLALFLLTARLARGEGTSTTVVWVPERVTVGLTSSWPGTDVLRCVTWVPALTIVGVTRAAWFVTGGLGGGGLCSFGIYNADGTVLLADTGPVSCAALGPVEATTLNPTTLTAGTKYNICTCANTSGGSYLAADAGQASSIVLMQNALTVPIGTQSSIGCSAALMPANLGTMTPASVNTPILILALPLSSTTTSSTTTTVTTTSVTATTTTSTTTTSTTTSTTVTTLALSCVTLEQDQLVAQNTQYQTGSLSPTTTKIRFYIIATRKDVAGAADPAPLVSGMSSTWDQVTTIANSPTGYRVTAYRSFNGSATTDNITAFFSANQRSGFWAVIECGGIDTSGTNGANAVRQPTTNTGTATSGTVTLGAFADPDNGVLGAWFPAETAGFPPVIIPGSGFTELADQADIGATENAEFEVEWKATNDTTVDASWTNNVVWGALAFEIVAAP